MSLIQAIAAGQPGDNTGRSTDIMSLVDLSTCSIFQEKWCEISNSKLSVSSRWAVDELALWCGGGGSGGRSSVDICFPYIVLLRTVVGGGVWVDGSGRGSVMDWAMGK